MRSKKVKSWEFRVVIIFDYITTLHLRAQKIKDFLLDAPRFNFFALAML